MTTFANPPRDFASLERNVCAKAMRRILPFLLLCYVVSYLDRVNVGFAQLQMANDLRLGPAAYGFAAGIFFVGYVLFEVPSNMALRKIGARLTFCRIMVAWGVTSAMTMFVTAAWQLYILRFLLGAFEAGFFPGVVLYFTYWFPARRRATVVSWFFVGAALSGVIGGPVSGWILRTFVGVWGLHGWQWLFALEGVPAILLGIAAVFLIVDKPETAHWLTEEEKKALHEIVNEGTEVPEDAQSIFKALANPRLYWLTAMYFAICAGCYGISFWLPVMIKDTGVKDVFLVGIYSAAAWTIGSAGIVLISMWSDKVGRRRAPLALCVAAGAIALGLMAHYGSSVGSVATLGSLGIAIAVIYAAVPIFWSIPPMYFSAGSLAPAIAIISSVGSLAGFVSPYVIGIVANRTGRASDGLFAVVALLALCGLAAVAGSLNTKRLQQAAV
ncbi:sugar phosphate permease [Trinickia symbiotica]|uniref:MFS transporter n=1 Tax=Trinickia symbiotica TaxID=863227 RepID=A0A2N7WTQ5_9BURK|nr:MFS transporter [Trinickia symbiotica]PMS32635.1 MFS transporter [Trinickia symbiotica]PPK41741.1 sugar phosphate permease [Trinickia symbiotica]